MSVQLPVPSGGGPQRPWRRHLLLLMPVTWVGFGYGMWQQRRRLWQARPRLRVRTAMARKPWPERLFLVFPVLLTVMITLTVISFFEEPHKKPQPVTVAEKAPEPAPQAPVATPPPVPFEHLLFEVYNIVNNVYAPLIVLLMLVGVVRGAHVSGRLMLALALMAWGIMMIAYAAGPALQIGQGIGTSSRRPQMQRPETQPAIAPTQGTGSITVIDIAAVRQMLERVP